MLLREEIFEKPKVSVFTLLYPSVILDKVTKNKRAERVLMRTRGKLQGIEEGSAISVDGHVNILIAQARSMSNLSRLFHGWQPYL